MSESKKDKIIQLFMDENYHQYVVMESGRIFKRRAKGHSGTYDRWKEVDLLREIQNDTKLK